MIRKLSTLFIALLVGVAADAATITVAMKNGSERELSYSKSVLKKKGVRPASGGVIDFGEISAISTADFDAYERAVNVTGKARATHVTVRYTGEGDVDALRLQKLERQRQGAGVARGAGGLMMLLGVLSDDDDVYAAGLVTYGAGTVAKDINTDKTFEAQNEAIANLQKKQQQREEADSLEEQFRIEYGDENVNSLIALIEGNHERALALANAAETSDDANYRFSAAWMKAIISADKGDRAAVEKEYDRLIVLDPEVSNYEDADRRMELLLKDLQELRQA